MQLHLQDLRFAWRQLRKSPGFTLTAILTLALGVGATAAVYSVIQTVLLEPLPYPDANNLVGVAFTFPHQKPNAEQAGSSADFIRDHAQLFSSTAILDDSAPAVNLSVSGAHPMQVTSLRVSEGYFRTLGVSPALGRPFQPEEDRPGSGKFVIVSDALWARQFDRNPSILGTVLHVNQEAYTVVGVMPASFAVSSETSPGVLGTPDVWMPLQLSDKDPGYDGDNYEMIARLSAGVTVEQAQQQLAALQQPFYQRYPNYKQWMDRDKELHEFRVWKLQDVLVGNVRRSLLTLMGAVLAVLLVACLNLAGLMAARAMRRSREMALRSALGATRWQLARLMLCEGLLLALGGGALATLVATAVTRLLLHQAPLAIPALRGGPDPWLLAGVVLLIAVAATGIVSTLPAWTLLRHSAREMRPGGYAQGDAVSHARLSRALMVVQIALAMILVSTASVLLGTFVKLRSVPSGVDPKQLNVFQVTLKGQRYANTRQTSQFVNNVLEELGRTPGVHRAAAVNGLPLDRGLNMGAYPVGRKELGRTVEFRSITPGYFQTMGIPLQAGRDLADSDRAESAPVLVIGETAARKWWPGRSPIGEEIRLGNEKNWRIVGVVRDVHPHSLVDDQGIVIYGPMVQLSDEFTGIVNGWFPTTFAVRAGAHMNLASIAQRAVEHVDPEIPVARLVGMQDVIDHTVEEPRFFSMLATAFSSFAVVLTVVGLFGLLSYQVTQRTREIGVRIALGADRFTILRIFLGRGLAVASLGVTLGMAATLMLRPVVNHVLADSGIDPSASTVAGAHVVMSGMQAMLFAAVAILVSTLAASWLPARRAAAVEPMQALRFE